MKNITKIFASTLFAAAVSLSLAAGAQTMKPGYATVVRVQGIASYSLGDNKWYPLLPGKTLPAGSTVRTGDNGSVDMVLGKAVVFPQSHKAPTRISDASDNAVRGLVSATPAAEQNVIRLSAGTVIAIDKLTTSDTGADTVGDTELDLKQGRIFASVKKSSATSQYLIKTPNGIAGVRGTKFTIAATGAVAVFESTSSGVVLSLTLDGATKTFLVAPGQSFDPAGGSEVSPLTTDAQRTFFNDYSQIQTIYNDIVNYDYTHGSTFVSPVSGN